MFHCPVIIWQIYSSPSGAVKLVLHRRSAEGFLESGRWGSDVPRSLRHWPVVNRTLSLGRIHAVEFGEHTRLACSDRRPRRSDAASHGAPNSEEFRRWVQSARAPTTAREGACAPHLQLHRSGLAPEANHSLRTTLTVTVVPSPFFPALATCAARSPNSHAG